MLEDFRKSFNSILYERTTSPLFGGLIISWIPCNWKIIYLTLFVSEKGIIGNKLDYIISNFSDVKHLVYFPLLSTIILLTIIPFISNGAYWLSLKFNKWKKDQKNIVEMKQLLTIEQSIELREQIIKQEERFDKLLEDKNSEIKQLKALIEEYNKNNLKSGADNNTSRNNLEELIELSKRVNGDKNEILMYDELVKAIQGGYSASSSSKINSRFISLMESNDIVQNIGGGRYQFTNQGKIFQKLMIK